MYSEYARKCSDDSALIDLLVVSLLVLLQKKEETAWIHSGILHPKVIALVDVWQAFPRNT